MRIGDTVRRPLRPFSLTVLARLRDAGFTGALWGGTPAAASPAVAAS